MDKEIITSLQNSLIKDARSLQQKKYREKEKQFLIEGIRFCEDALAVRDIVVTLFYDDQLLRVDRGTALLEQARGQKIPTYQVNSAVLGSLAETQSPQGAVAVCNMPQWQIEKSLVNDEVLVFVLDRIQDPGNMGTIIRLASAVNAQAIFCLKGTVDIFSGKTLRSTMGAIFHTPVFTKLDWEPLLQLLDKHEINAIVGDLNAQDDLWNTEFPRKVALVLGNEGEGVGEVPWLKTPVGVKIPLLGPAESLNVGVAGGVLAYEYIRQVKRRGR